VWTEQTDSLAQRDTGWMQFYCETNQEALDMVIQAFKIAETVLLPVMLVLDAFVLSHTEEPVDIPDQATVDSFLPPYNPRFRLDPSDPHSFYGLVAPEHYMELRHKMYTSMEEAVRVTGEVAAEFGKVFGRSYDLVEKYRMDDAETVLVTSGTITGTSRVVVDEWRARGEKVGLVKVCLFRPTPSAAIREALAGAKKVAVVDRNISQGHGGIFASEIKSVLYGVGHQPPLFSFIVGLGGRDVTPQSIHSILQYTQEHDRPHQEAIWMEVKE